MQNTYNPYASHNQTKNARHLKLGTDVKEVCTNLRKQKNGTTLPAKFEKSS